MTALVLLFFAAITYLLLHLRLTPEQNIRNAAPVSNNYKSGTGAKVPVDKKLFTMVLPSGWHEASTDKKLAITPTYTFDSPQVQAQTMDIYIDKLPTSMAVNKAIVVSTQGDGLAYDSVSDNCTNFTEASLKNPKTGDASARWQTINFLCDMSNPDRAVVGTMSTEGINQVTVVGPTVGAHKLFITFTDNNINPNYSSFYEILQTLHFK